MQVMLAPREVGMWKCLSPSRTTEGTSESLTQDATGSGCWCQSNATVEEKGLEVNQSTIIPETGWSPLLHDHLILVTQPRF